MKVVVTHLGSINECLVASSLNKRLRETADEIHWVVADRFCANVFKYADRVKVFTADQFDSGVLYDWAINLHPDSGGIRPLAKKYNGFIYDAEADQYSHILYGQEKSNMKLFQIYFRLAGLSWKGEGYDLTYYPKTKSKKDRAGLAIAHGGLRRYVRNKLELDSMKVWIVPYKRNIFRHMDELNRCGTIMTDDLSTMSLSIFLRKQIHFMQTLPLNFKLEFFGTGEIYNVPASITI